MRILALAAFVVTSVAGTSFGQRINAPGNYNVNVAVDPSYVPPGFPPLGPNVYAGVVTIKNTPHGVSAKFRGTNQEGYHLNMNATFMTGWIGMLLGDHNLGGTIVPDALIGIDVAWMMEAKVNGIGLVDGVTQQVIAKFGQAGVVLDFKVKPLH
jgi:hypothetical protein